MAPSTSLSNPITVVAILLVAVLAVTAQGGNGDCDVQEECEFKVNCIEGTATSCPGWANQTGIDALDWVGETSCRNNYKNLTDPSTPLMPCLTIFFKTSPANSAAGLESPWICATGHNASSLSFRYAITGPLMTMNCSLSVYLNTKINTTRIWTSSGATTYDWVESGNIDIQSPDCPFQLIFEGKKTSDGPCSNAMYNYLSMSDIVYEGVAPPPTTTSTTTTTSLTTSAAAPSVVTPTDKSTQQPAVRPITDVTTSPSEDTNQGSLSETEPDNNTLGVGAVAGIGVGAAVLVIACLIVVLIYVWKKRTKRDKTDSRLVAEGTENSDTLQTVVNPGYQPDNNRTTGSLPEESSSARTDTVTAETYEGLSPRPDSKFYTTLTTKHPASTSETYEGLAARPESRFYTDLAAEGASQPDSTPENYELLTVTPEASHYTALTKSGHNMKKSK